MKGTALPFTLHNFLNFRSASTNYVATGDQLSWDGDDISVMEEQDFSLANLHGILARPITGKSHRNKA